MGQDLAKLHQLQQQQQQQEGGDGKNRMGKKTLSRKGSCLDELLNATGFPPLRRTDSNQTMMPSDDEADHESDDDDAEIASLYRNSKHRDFILEQLNSTPTKPKRKSRASSMPESSRASRDSHALSDLLSVHDIDDEEDLELLSHLNSASEYSDDKAIHACEREIRVRLLDPTKDTRSRLEREVMLLRQQLESQSTELLKLRVSQATSPYHSRNAAGSDSTSVTSDIHSESDAFSSVSGAGFL
eukprot:CAMPEP_0171531722 /NCGR_PEP_ID=MMETSP0959-20130129/14235_1 /TAXON_ID=87120 /ORGANISM="Aurantiochytrium limacinum, Strain ATCCMYA-1381" /LENGTH=242 /DNA_ID=CAMNT_0012075545 /DNA_START=306 /DNA_END=1035 /DNA_ORIENTATION=+